jgi:hypothetical protein
LIKFSRGNLSKCWNDFESRFSASYRPRRAMCTIKRVRAMLGGNGGFCTPGIPTVLSGYSQDSHRTPGIFTGFLGIEISKIRRFPLGAQPCTNGKGRIYSIEWLHWKTKSNENFFRISSSPLRSRLDFYIQLKCNSSKQYSSTFLSWPRTINTPLSRTKKSLHLITNLTEKYNFFAV